MPAGPAQPPPRRPRPPAPPRRSPPPPGPTRPPPNPKLDPKTFFRPPENVLLAPCPKHFSSDSRSHREVAQNLPSPSKNSKNIPKVSPPKISPSELFLQNSTQTLPSPQLHTHPPPALPGLRPPVLLGRPRVPRPLSGSGHPLREPSSPRARLPRPPAPRSRRLSLAPSPRLLRPALQPAVGSGALLPAAGASSGSPGLTMRGGTGG